jgi:multidrug efflux pump subunit AcrA (membrane-fusion protein)
VPPAEVTVSKPEQKEVVNWNEFTGRTAAVKLVTVTPRVSGYIVDIPFKEGDIVHSAASRNQSSGCRNAGGVGKSCGCKT